MSAIRPNTRNLIRAYVQAFVAYSVELGGSATLDGTFEECARLIANDHHPEATRSYKIRWTMSAKTLQEIERQVLKLDAAPQTEPTLSEMIAAVVETFSSGDNVNRIAFADLYIRKKDGSEYFFALKTPTPSKVQCLEIMRRVLRIHAARELPRPFVNAYFAMAYNPFGRDKADYEWEATRQHTLFDETVLIGEEFWNIIGGDGVYEELMDIYREVTHDYRQYLVGTVPFGF